MPVTTAEYKGLEGMIRPLPDEDEDEEDLRDVMAREDEECVPFEEVVREIGLV